MSRSRSGSKQPSGTPATPTPVESRANQVANERQFPSYKAPRPVMGKFINCLRLVEGFILTFSMQSALVQTRIDRQSYLYSWPKVGQHTTNMQVYVVLGAGRPPALDVFVSSPWSNRIIEWGGLTPKYHAHPRLGSEGCIYVYAGQGTREL